ncbi:N-alpha-acetyltransferase 25, NatB auxiliary subunit [Venturia canescens]|uniref:N-alpha-acetyltransferase 25, NatB auxiliary subunit n=1 Tax=Venturia canescens TaxID=32260 RepID=UPI001C9D400A|nr:N-alpha-acetyltransferase 25, NatB auxiliary subunit [Venturia canescens]
MASKAHVDGSVNERRLRPIYDWLDNGNNKKALQEADKVLRKMPTNQCARVLKALALLRLGKEEECLSIMDTVRAEVPCEDSTLQAMSICYKETHQPDRIREVYEAAAKTDPTNEELLTHLFMAYVRLGDYRRQQQTALALYKLKAKNPYYFWAVMSVVMQAVSADDKLAKQVILPLAERMVLKLVGEGKLEAEQEVQLYLMILELQGKSEEVLKVLLGPLGSLLSSVPQRKALLLLQLERYSEAANDFRELISQDVDNWAYYKDYLTCALRQQSPIECLEFLNKMSRRSEKKARAPYLARFELYKRLGSSAPSDDGSFDIVDLMQQYFLQFGEKNCVVGDLRLYLNLLTVEERLEFLRKIDEQVGVASDSYPECGEQMQRHIHYEQLRRICGMHHPPYADTDKRKQLVERFRNLYENGNEACPASERLPTDFSPADSYVLLASHLYVQLWFETRDASHLYRGMAVLERALTSSPANFHLKIMLVRIYLEAGLVGGADHAFALLEAKQIQLDSLGYLHTPLLAPMGHLTRATALLDHTAKFFVANYKQSADHLTFAYKYGSFVKIQEFVELKERLENSLHFATTSVDKMLLELSWCDTPVTLSNTLSNMKIQPQEDTIQWQLLRDNRDLEVVVGWEPLDENEPDPRMREETRSCMFGLLSARSLILRMIAASAEPDCSSLLESLADQLEKVNDQDIPRYLEKFQAPGSDKTKAESVLVPLDAFERLREAHCSEQLRLFAEVARSLARSPSPDYDSIARSLRSSKALQPGPQPPIDVPVSYKAFFMRASTCGESLALLGAMCVAYTNRSQQRATTVTANRKKNKKDANAIVASQSDYSQTWQEIGALLAERIKSLEAELTELEKIHVFTDLPADEDAWMLVGDRAQESLCQTCWTLKSRLQLTTRLLNGLRS